MEALRHSFAAGAFAGCCFVAALLGFDVGGLAGLIARDAAGFQPLLLLLSAFAALFGVAVAASSLAFAEPSRGEPRRGVRAFSAVRRPQPLNR
jgi:hypothetical protein